MLTLVILLILAWQYYIGYSRGMMLQAVYLLGSLVSLFVASLYYQPFGDFIYLWVPYASPTEGASTYFFDSQYLFDLDKVFYAGLAFFTIYILAYTLVRFLGLFLHFFKLEKLDKDARIKHGAGALSVIVTWIGLAMFLTILATIPVPIVQDNLNKSFLAKFLIDSPILAQFLENLWLTKIL